MAQPAPELDSLDQLQTPQQVELLDKIDELRNQGLGYHGISLPQLVVCGDQSSGKSSLLEGLTRLRFPTQEGLCTTFATEVVLRKEPNVEISCTITPSKSRSQPQRRELAKFKRIFSSCEEFPFLSIVNEAKDHMGFGVTANPNNFFEDVLRIKYSGPDLPSLTIVDLPGLIDTQLNGGNGAEKVAELVTSYVRNEASIIMAVISADYDAELQRVFRYLKEFDPKGIRTLGIITKPDRAASGGEREQDMIRLVKNDKYPLKHGWHAVKNRDFTTRKQSDIERDATERDFFATGQWAIIPKDDVGITTLRTKLSRMLLEHIGKELPSLVAAVQNAITSTESGLKALGNARETSRQQRGYLTGHAENFQMLTRDALRGIYNNRFFALSCPNEQTPTRLRTEIQNLNIAFARAMYQKGHTWNISNERTISPLLSNTEAVSPLAVQEYDAWFEEPTWISRTEFLEKHVGDYVRHSRPSGLPSLVNPWVIGEVFRQQSQPWKEIAQHHLKRIFQAVKDYIEETVGSLMDTRTCNMLMLKHIQPELDQRWRSVESKFEELLVPYTEQDPVTYDPSFILEIEETRMARHIRSSSQAEGTAGTHGQSNMASMSRGFGGHLLTESMDDFTNSEILDLMQTYYKRAISVFINNIAVLAIENCLIKDLSSIFSPTLIANLDDDKLHAIASESSEIRHDRDSLRQKLSALEGGKSVLYEHIAMNPSIRAKDSRPSRIHAQPRKYMSQRGESAEKEEKVEDITSHFNNLVVTPPPSRSKTPPRSRPRVDSATRTPSGSRDGRKRSAHAWPPRFGLAGEDESGEY
ncbi:dynamin-1 [Dothidotthia symphoricarpi CBS 119687]|uniref:Dynamin-1 n=1 Tax=Dothidotthia symphoricarpi CBS 119687 TaxID=1392245 RepID=A0A6A6AKM8_9PLEO|nr:dynamin-1 [Dothidotthia symphoricarpi CBS 119687]KAF2132512.1 dynamin-1 [Dothidotthia symphoricarpi CBS 119687]